MEELHQIKAAIKSKLLPRLSDEIESWAVAYDGDTDPDSYFEPIRDFVNTYIDEFDGDDEAVGILRSGLDEIDRESSNLELEGSDGGDEDYAEIASASGLSGVLGDDRSIYEDVDN